MAVCLPGSSYCCHSSKPWSTKSLLGCSLLSLSSVHVNCSVHSMWMSMYVHFWFCLAEGTPNIIIMVYVWNQTPHSTDSKKTCSIWPSDSNLFSRNRGTQACTQTCSSCCDTSRSFYRYWGEPYDFRFKPVQKFDGCSGENYSGGAQPHPGAAEQTVIAQSQHHQQFLGQLLFSLFERL